MWRQKKKYKRPRHPWRAERIEEEHRLAKEYGIRRMRELWKAKAILHNWQRLAKESIGLPAEQRESVQKLLLGKLQTYGLVGQEADIDDVLSLTIKDILDRRLSSVVVKKGLALTPKQARQFILHGKILVNGKKTNAPSYLVKVTDEISYVTGFAPKLKPEEIKSDKIESVKKEAEIGEIEERKIEKKESEKTEIKTEVTNG